MRCRTSLRRPGNSESRTGHLIPLRRSRNDCSSLPPSTLGTTLVVSWDVPCPPSRPDQRVSTAVLRPDKSKFANNQLKSVVCLSTILSLVITGCAPTVNLMPSEDQRNAWVIRTDFSDSESWSAVRELIAAPQVEFGQEFYAYVEYVNDEKYAGMEPATLVHSLPDDYPGFFCFVADEITFAQREHTILVVGFSPNSVNHKDYERSRTQTPLTDIQTFRAIPSAIQSIENNLSIANMDFEEFAEAVDDDGVFRGFPE